MREGAACSPCLWAVYADGLLLVLRKSKLGCHVAGQWMGGFLYADDISLQQNLNFDADAATRRSGFIGRSVEVREQFSSASPAHVLKAVRILCCHGYGAVLWRIDSSSASSFFKAYNRCVKESVTIAAEHLHLPCERTPSRLATCTVSKWVPIIGTGSL